MPNITAVGTYTEETPGFEMLGGSREVRTLLFSSGTLPTTLQIVYTDDEGVDHALEGGAITALPSSMVLDRIKRPVKIVATGGSPLFNVSGA